MKKVCTCIPYGIGWRCIVRFAHVAHGSQFYFTLFNLLVLLQDPWVIIFSVQLAHEIPQDQLRVTVYCNSSGEPL